MDAIIHTKSSVRKKRDINVIETKKVDITNEDGYAVICENLGIEKSEYNILERKNILVEGNCDKKYLEGLMRYFGLKVPNIISVNGANNIVKYLEFYESYYKNIDNYIPQIKVIYDNDCNCKLSHIATIINKSTFRLSPSLLSLELFFNQIYFSTIILHLYHDFLW